MSSRIIIRLMSCDSSCTGLEMSKNGLRVHLFSEKLIENVSMVGQIITMLPRLVRGES